MELVNRDFVSLIFVGVPVISILFLGILALNWIHRDDLKGWTKSEKTSYNRQRFSLFIISLFSLIALFNIFLSLGILGIGTVIYSLVFMSSNVAPLGIYGYPQRGNWARLEHILQLITGIILIASLLSHG